ncbi:unnamed protein product [Albugo candida]|uniref:Uncharacterized protein n=1 Tax=Albugo candida TaxID=65357 RepID=A0A024GAR8_9STRA|nr:unnamed protein product [Albugo candida]|eukprot:CCI43650.1 unnamed protein product [Albugo candida]
MRCITEKTQFRAYERTNQRVTTAQLSSTTSFTSLDEAVDKKELGECINGATAQHKGCLQIIFVPNFMYEYEFEQFILGDKINQSEHQPEAKLTAKYVRYDTQEGAPHGEPAQGILRLFGVSFWLYSVSFRLNFISLAQAVT